MNKLELFNLVDDIRDNIELLDDLLNELPDDSQDKEIFDYGMEQCPERLSSKQRVELVSILEIKVPTQRDKVELLKAFQYLHDNPFVVKNYYAIYALVECNPELIRVVSD